MFSLPSGFDMLIPVDYVTFRCEDRHLTVASRPYGSQTIIPDVMELENIGFVLSANLENLSSLVVTFSGQWRVAGTQVNVQATYTDARRQFDLVATPSGVSVDLVNLASDLTGLSLPNPFGDALVFDFFVLTGSISDRNTTFVLEVSSAITKIYLVFHQPSQQGAQKAIAADFTNYRFSALVEQVTGLDLSGIPYFGSIMGPGVALTISNANITGLARGTFMESDLLSRITSDSTYIHSGIRTTMSFDFLAPSLHLFSIDFLRFVPFGGLLSIEDLFMMIPGINFDDIRPHLPDLPSISGLITFNELLAMIPNINIGSISLPFDGFLTLDELSFMIPGIDFGFPSLGGLPSLPSLGGLPSLPSLGNLPPLPSLNDLFTLSDLLSVIPGIDFGAIPLPFELNLLSSIDISSFSFDLDPLRAICIEASYDDGLGFFDGLVELNNANIHACLSREPIRLRVEVGGAMRIGRTEFTGRLLLDSNDDYVIEASASTFPISDALSQFHASILPPQLSSLSIPFVDFSVDDTTLTYPLASRPQQIRIGGTPVVAGYDILSADMIIIRGASGTSLIIGIDVGAVVLSDLLRTISGRSFNNIAILNQQLDVAILISPVTLPNVRLHGEQLENFPIRRGVSVQAEMSFPPGCSSDSFCAVAQSLLGPSARLILQGSMDSTSQFSLFAGVSELTVGSGLTISDAGLEVEVGAQTSIGITGSIVLSNPPITLTSKIFLSTSGVVLRLTLEGCWENAFGADWLAICNILGAVGVGPGVPITALEIGGELRLGSCANPITAIGFLGIDAATPTNNYYYAEFATPDTFTSILEALCISTNGIPGFLGGSGFPNGFLFSFSILGHELPHAGISIPPGFRFNGTINILGLEGYADVTIDLPTGYRFEVALSPIDIGDGLLRMTASPDDSSMGPRLISSITLLPSYSSHTAATGYMQVLGIARSATMEITDSTYTFSTSGRMLGLFEAELNVTAPSGSLPLAPFAVSGRFRADLSNGVEQRVRQVLEESANIATRLIGDAQEVVAAQQGVFDHAVGGLQSAQREVDDANSAFDNAERRLREARDHVNSVCSLRNCGRGKYS